MLYMVLLVVLQGYILRLRAVICSWVYPERARERAIYLYNDILQRRNMHRDFMILLEEVCTTGKPSFKSMVRLVAYR